MTWRQTIRQAIDKAIQRAKSEGKDKQGIKKAIDESWQWGERTNHPYKVWLEERKTAYYMEGIITINSAKPKKTRQPVAKTDKVVEGQLPLF
ncbi:MAG TPA: hypothetical protein V6D25_30975 [Leptolyngbyaceae cyanobacterium]